PALVEHMGDAFPELRKNPGRVAEVIKGEEADFLRTLDRGLSLFEEAARKAVRIRTTEPEQVRPRFPSLPRGLILGKDVFDLHTTYGFPPDLTRQMAQERGLTIDEDGYVSLMREFEDKSRSQAVAQQVALNVSGGLPETDDRPKWFGQQADGKILGWIADN